MLLGAPLGAGTPHWCARSIIGHDSPVFQHGELFSGAAGATRLMRIVRRQALPAKPARTRCIAAGSQHYERSMSTPPDWPGPNTSPPLHSQAKAFSAIGATDPWSLSTRSAHSQAQRPTRRLARRQTLSEQLARRLPTGPFSTFAPLKNPASNARSGAPNHHSSPRALVLSRFPLFWHKFTVVNDDGCLRKSLPYLRNSVNWGYAFSQTRWSS